MSEGQRGHTNPIVYSETLMQDSQIKSDWLVNNAVIAFFAAILIAQTPQSATGRADLILGFDYPNIPTWWTDSTIALLLAISVTLAVAGVIPRLRRRTIQWTTPLVPTLEFMTLAAFTAGFAESLGKLPRDQWWSDPLIVGGILFMLFLFVRFVVTFVIVMRYWLTKIRDQESST